MGWLKDAAASGYQDGRNGERTYRRGEHPYLEPRGVPSISPSEPPSGVASRASDGVAGAPNRGKRGREMGLMGIRWSRSLEDARYLSGRNEILTVDSMLMENGAGRFTR